jgi:predicted RNA-binding Zn ribbon-like protein
MALHDLPEENGPLNESQYLKQGFGLRFLWLDFVNSFEKNGLGGTADHLRNPQWVHTFLRHWKMSLPPTAMPWPAMERLRQLLRGGAENLSSPSPLTKAELQLLNDFLSVFARRQLFQRQNGLVLQDVPRAEDWHWVQARIARSFAETLTMEPRDRVKICPDPLCRWIFYDTTKGKTRVWCNERTCGNRNRVRRARAAHHTA